MSELTVVGRFTATLLNNTDDDIRDYVEYRSLTML